ncbi:GNAT family N-acetyltransferase [Streptomyces sp. ASQP_92]|uniref:GNAT family N-acetyltransferase n=1 Tax=Streptomyces sp. ASQP_92 TaxID=2979116 RepID=UPI0021BFE93A|nr:GNAT family N-acetyltransferase [Streptomyces sp. ASQP_92]MCT9091939.1 GNAT family N-acetyltransferase [Streptomyces sp. ASQP_92]
MFRLETEVDKDRQAQLHRRLRDTNTERSEVLRALRGTPSDKEVPLHVWGLNEAGLLAGGLVGRTWASWLHVDLLWIDPGVRSSGLGTQLLCRAEELARSERGCGFARVSTWDFQAPGFYRGRGYEVVGVVPDYPPGVTEYTLTKPLP